MLKKVKTDISKAKECLLLISFYTSNVLIGNNSLVPWMEKVYLAMWRNLFG